MVEKLTLYYLETVLVDIPAVSMPITHTLKTHPGIVLCDKTAHCGLCPQAQGAPVQ